MKGHDEIHQTVTIPRIQCSADNSREIFGVWTPYFDRTQAFRSDQISDEYITDAQGLELIKRKVYQDKSEEFSKVFFPVDAVISMSDRNNKNSLTVWNDRPQAGAVMSNSDSGGIKLLIDRRV